MGTIRRQTYIDKIEKYLGKETIIVLVGQRRVGKSCILKMIRDDKMADSDNNVIYIDKEKWQYDAIQTYQDLNEYIEKHWDNTKHNYILIDEVQDIKEQQKSLVMECREDEIKSKIDLAVKIENLLGIAKKQMGSSATDNPSIKSIRQNRKKEQERNHFDVLEEAKHV